MSEKQTTAKKKPGRKPKADKTAEADNRNGGAVGESGAPDNGSGGSGENTEQAAHAPDQNRAKRERRRPPPKLAAVEPRKRKKPPPRKAGRLPAS